MATKVYLRKYKISKGRESLYLQYYPPIRNKRTMKMVQKEMLGLYIYENPQGEEEIQHNKNTLHKAKAVEAIRIQMLINEEYDFLDKDKMKEDFLEYFAEIAVKKDQKWEKVFKHFSNFVKGKCTFAEVDVDLCRRFREYLLTDARQLSDPTKKLKNNSLAGYFSTFRALLKIAYRDRRIKENVNDYLDKIKWEDTHKEYLTLEEVKQLVDTPCDIPVLKAASIFSCMTGLRISDILQLQWAHIRKTTNGGYCMRIRTEKTETEATLPISVEALEWCGESGTGLVFKKLQRYMVYKPLKEWIQKAGIEKAITFHLARHTFATLQIAMGTDIFTVSKMLTHKNVSTTQIYAELVSEKKRESANKISLR